MEPRPARRSPTISELMILIAGLGLGLWIVLPPIRRGEVFADSDHMVLTATFLLGGLSIFGPPLLIFERRRSRPRRPWGAGRFLWFTQGMAGWLLWPPIVYARARNGEVTQSASQTCYAYGTPLMAIYVGSALLFGGGFRRSRRRAMRRSWREKFGLVLAMAWACLGLYILSTLYRDDFRR